MIPLPERIHICGMPYTIEVLDKVFDDGVECVGTINFLAGHIRLKKDVSPSMLRQTLMHEILHGICYHLGIKDTADEEKLVDTIATALFVLTRDNGQLIDWLRDTSVYNV